MKSDFELRTTTERGDGVFSLRPFDKDEIVIEGVIKCFVEKNNSHASQIAENTFVIHDGIMPKCNHSCDPNCGIKVNKTGAHDLVARRSISAGEEITYDYAMRNYCIEHFPSNCSCGATNCRKHVTGWKDLPSEKKVEYEGYIAPYLHDMDKNITRQSLDAEQVEKTNDKRFKVKI